MWNLVYDGLLKAVDPVKDLNAITFADDLALVITIRKTQKIGDRVHGLVKMVAEWCRMRVFGWRWRRPK